MKKLILTMVVGLWAFVASADVTITNLVVAQRPGTKLVDIKYDVSSTTINAVTISLAVSNGVAKVNATNLTGAVGADVTTGAGKSIVWNMVTDWNTNAATLSFSVFASAPDCPVPKTGQTVSYRTGDDGDLEAGVAWPNPRFTVITNGTDQTVIDNLTGLEWVKAPHALSKNFETTNWTGAVYFCNYLGYAGHSDWRLPSIIELESLVNCGNYNLALPAGHPFVGVQSTGYWSGTSGAADTGYAWCMSMGSGKTAPSSKAIDYYFYVWPVRGGVQ